MTIALSLEEDVFRVTKDYLYEKHFMKKTIMDWNEMRITDMKIKEVHGKADYPVNQTDIEWKQTNAKVINALKKLYYDKRNHITRDKQNQ